MRSQKPNPTLLPISLSHLSYAWTFGGFKKKDKRSLIKYSVNDHPRAISAFSRKEFWSNMRVLSWCSFCTLGLFGKRLLSRYVCLYITVLNTVTGWVTNILKRKAKLQCFLGKKTHWNSTNVNQALPETKELVNVWREDCIFVQQFVKVTRYLLEYPGYQNHCWRKKS